MNIRVSTLWRVPVFCTAASWIGYYATVYLGRFFFVMTTVGADGIREVTADPVRSLVFHGVLFLASLLAGGLWAFRAMTKQEIAASAGIISVVYLGIVLAQLYFPGFPLWLSVRLAVFQNWTGFVSSLLIRLGVAIRAAVVVSCVSPLLFVLFGRKEPPQTCAQEDARG